MVGLQLILNSGATSITKAVLYISSSYNIKHYIVVPVLLLLLLLLLWLLLFIC